MNVRTLSIPIALLVFAAAACQGPQREAIRLGVLADCEGFVAAFYGVTLAGAEMPLLQRGGSIAGSAPVDGVEGVTISGHPVELSFGCAGDAIGNMVETRRLVELEDVDVLIGPNTIPDTPALTEYARRHPQTTFVIATMEHATGLDLGPNVFRFTADSVQTSAGLGGYAFNQLGWRSAETVASPDLWQWGVQAGFVAEFCSLGGSVVERHWLDVLPEDVPEELAALSLTGPDGFFLATDTNGTRDFLRRYAKLHRLAGRVVSGAYTSAPVLLDPSIVDRLGDELLGVVTASFVPLDDSQASWNAYVDEFDDAFPDLAAIAASIYHLMDIDYENAMEAVMQGLEVVGGDLSDGGEAYRDALGKVQLDAPNGPIRLDDRRQAIVPIYLSRVEKDDHGELVYRTIRRLDGVDQTYGGVMDLATPSPDRTQPVCRAGNPPPWANAA